MKKLSLFFLLIALVLVACGGNTEPVTNANNEANAPAENNNADEADANADEEMADEEMADEEMANEEMADEEMADEEMADEEMADEEMADEEMADEEMADEAPASDYVYSGTDPDTGLEVNPTDIEQGVEFIVRGSVISMNLTPQSDPEFVIQSPDGTNYRIHTQPLGEIFFLDGVTQLLPHEYKIGMEAHATTVSPVGSTASDVLESTDLVLISLPQ